MARKDLLSKLADAGEEAIGRLADAPGADRLAGAVTSMRDRIDDLQKRVRGIEALEARISELERRVVALESKSTASGAATRKPAARAKPKASTTRSASTKKP
jgi:polyhydroxyalkanoate synthesis regulator phasin